MPSFDGRIVLFLLVCSLALFFAEMQARQEASSRWLCLALVWITVVGMLVYVYSGD
jgi:hypothetical protein